MKKQQQEKVVYKSPSKFLFSLTRALLSVALFVAVYKLYIEPKYSSETFTYFVFTFTAMVLTGWIANFIARLVTKYWTSHFTLHSFNRTLLHCLIYTVLIVSGFISRIFAEYSLIYVCVILLVIKLVIYLLTDYAMYNVK